MDTQNVVYIYNGISLSLKKVENSDILNMDEPGDVTVCEIS